MKIDWLKLQCNLKDQIRFPNKRLAKLLDRSRYGKSDLSTCLYYSYKTEYERRRSLIVWDDTACDEF